MNDVKRKRCSQCEGYGFIYYKVPHYETVTRDMAIDACDRSLEGEQVQWGEDEVQEPCENCNGTGKVEESA